MTSSDPSPTAGHVPPLADRLFKGSALMIVMRWFVRLLGLANTAVLARLLTPDDFGVIGLAIILVAFVQSITDVGVGLSLIQNPHAERRHYDSAWTIQIGQSTVVSLIIVACAPFSKDYFGDARVVPVLYLIALSMFIQGFMNIGVVDFRKKLQFEKDFLFTALSRFLTLIATVTLAFALRSYWAIAYGAVAGAVLELALSYILSAYRPRLCTTAIKELWSFSQWLLVINILTFLLNRGERFIIGRLVSTKVFGYYGVGYDLAMMPTLEIVMPIVRAVDASVALIKDEIDRLKGAVLNLLSAVMLFALPVSLGFLMVAREFVTIVLGVPWLPTLPFVQAAAIAAIVEMPMMIIKGVLVRTGHIRIVGAIIGVQVALLLASIYPVYDTFGLAAVIYGKAIITGATLVVMMITLGRHIGVGVREYFAILIRPALGAALMVLALHAIGIAMGPGVILSLIVKVVAGAVVYGVVVLALWRLSGRPDGAERFVLDKASGFLAATGLKSRS